MLGIAVFFVVCFFYLHISYLKKKALQSVTLMKNKDKRGLTNYSHYLRRIKIFKSHILEHLDDTVTNLQLRSQIIKNLTLVHNHLM